MKPRAEIRIDEALIELLAKRRAELGADFPRICLFLFDCADVALLRACLARIPEAFDDWLAEVVVVPGGGSRAPLPDAPQLAPGRGLRVSVHRTPRDLGYGGLRKSAFEYALQRGFDSAISMRGDGEHPPEMLPALLQAAFDEPRSVLLASRLLHRRETLRAGMSLLRLLAHALATGFQNRLLGLRLRDYHSSYRVHPVRALRRIPFQLDGNDRSFEMQLLIQWRALGVAVREVEVLPAWREYPSAGTALRQALRDCGSALDYRLHQLHVTRSGRYFVDHHVPYTLKQSPTGSHMQIVSAIRPGSRVLDLGCSQGLLAGPLRAKGVQVTGVDAGGGEELAEELSEYHQRDLEQPLELPEGRVFDYVVISDVIEHLRARGQLLRGARRYLKREGRLLISAPNIAVWFYRLSLLVGRFEYGPRGVLDEGHVRLFTGATFRREVERAGFHVVRQRVTALPFEVVFESTGRSRLIQAVASAYHWLARLWPAMFAYQYVLEAEITTLDDEATPA